MVEHKAGVWALLDELHAVLQFSGAHGQLKVEPMLAQRASAAHKLGAQAEPRRRGVAMQHLTQTFDDAIARVALHIGLEVIRSRPSTNRRGDGEYVSSAALDHDVIRFLNVILRSHIDLHVDRFHVQTCIGLHIVRRHKIMPQHFRCTFDPGRTDDVPIPEMLMRVDDQ
jgi:hypothetical protein